jgi:hypothetical protein
LKFFAAIRAIGKAGMKPCTAARLQKVEREALRYSEAERELVLFTGFDYRRIRGIAV